MDGVLVDSPHELAWRDAFKELMEGDWRAIRDQTSWTAERFTPEVYQQVMELRPAVRSDKGDAVGRIVADSGARAVIVVGDDLGDLPAFAAAAQLSAESADGLRVAVRSGETPPALLADADLTIEGPPGVREFLQQLISC